jgi:hypothetical protein
LKITERRNKSPLKAWSAAHFLRRNTALKGDFCFEILQKNLQHAPDHGLDVKVLACSEVHINK